MKSRPPPIGMGRPLKELDEKQIADLAFRGCHTATIARLIGCDEKTLRNRFSDLISKKRAERKLAIQDQQWKLLMKGDRTMAVWLGKNDLGQADKTEVKQEVTQKMYGVEAPVDEV